MTYRWLLAAAMIAAGLCFADSANAQYRYGRRTINPNQAYRYQGYGNLGLRAAYRNFRYRSAYNGYYRYGYGYGSYYNYSYPSYYDYIGGYYTSPIYYSAYPRVYTWWPYYGAPGGLQPAYNYPYYGAWYGKYYYPYYYGIPQPVATGNYPNIVINNNGSSLTPMYDPNVSGSGNNVSQQQLIDYYRNLASRQPYRIQVPPRRSDEDREAARKENRERQSKESLVSGMKSFSAGNYHRAADRYRDSIRANDKNPTAYFLLSQAYFAEEKFDDAVKSLKEGLKLNPDWPQIEFDLRTLYGDPDDHSPQMAKLARALQQNPLDQNALYLLGFQLFMTGNKGKARTILEQTARLETDDSHLKPFFDYFDKLEGKPVRTSTPTGNAKPYAGIKLPDA